MHKLRPYQDQAVSSIFEEWKTNQSTLVNVPTGGGKTQIFCECIKRNLPGRSLIIVHRSELAAQAAKRLLTFGIEAEIEMADQVASTNLFNRSPVVIATVQTLISGSNEWKRLHRFPATDFQTLIIDECHHATSKSWRQCIEHFRSNPNLRVCGFTATPDRYDEQALGQVFQSVAVDIEILDLIHEGYLVPVEQQMVAVKGLDFSHIRTTCGDLNGADLSAVMEAEENIQGVVGSSIEIIGNKRTLAFAASVKQAEMMASIFNRHRPGMAAWVCGTTPKEDRRRINLEFDQGKIQVLANVGTHTEGFDSPGVEIVIMGRPTKSRCLYAQCCGRALRPLPGTVEGLESDEERKLAIAASAKPSALIVDYVGVSGSHKLIHTADILGGKVSDEAVERAIKIAKERGKVRMVELLDESENLIRKEAEARRLAEEARKARLLAKVKWSAQQVSPFDVLQISPTKERGWNNGKALSEKQRAFLLRNGIPPDGLSYSHGQQLIGSIIGRMGKNLCTFKQARLLKKHGYETRNLGMGDATKLIDALAKNGWRRPAEPVGVPA